MNLENKSSYYAIIPAFIRYNKELKFAERLMYGEITALSNKEGYCFASNRYFAELYGVSISTISRWISHLVKLNSLHVEIIRNDKKEIIERRIYVIDNPYMQFNQYPYEQKGQEPISKKSKDNNININKIDRLFNYIINKENEKPEEFKDVEYDEIIIALKRYEMLYTKDAIEFISNDNLNKIKEITYAISLIVKNKLFYLNNKISRDKLISIYNECKNKEKEYEGTENEIEDFARYYYRSIANVLTKEIQPSFFVPENDEIEF